MRWSEDDRTGKAVHYPRQVRYVVQNVQKKLAEAMEYAVASDGNYDLIG
jgi:hypothetical protein